MNVAVAGAGYVGLSVALLLSRVYHVAIVDIDENRVESLRKSKSYLRDEGVEYYLSHIRELGLSFHPTSLDEKAYEEADYVVVATSTNYDPESNAFDTTAVETVIDTVRTVNRDAWIVIRSTVPIGYTAAQRKRRNDDHILFSPEFLREGHALHDCLNPSRIIVGAPEGDAAARCSAGEFARMLSSCSECPGEIPAIVCDPTEAEAIKLFSNTYLALRISYFNELDTYCELKGLCAKNVIEGVTLDPRIGDFYDNPSFGYGGYCLPKDVKQLLANYERVPQNLIGAIVEANRTRKVFVAEEVLRRVQRMRDDGLKHPIVGVFRLTMKAESDNFRESSVIDVINILRAHHVEIIVFEPLVADDRVLGCRVERDLEAFKQLSSVILANRWSEELDSCSEKVFSRDLFNSD